MTGAGEQGWSAASVVVVGGGISGVACARALDAAGLDVVLLDRGRAIGGRMATRTLRAGRVVDVGASYVVARDERFADVVAAWRARGLATVWTDTFISSDDGHERTTKGPLRRGSPTGLRSLVADLASPLVVHRHEARTVTSTASEVLVDGRPARAAVLAMPDPQAKRLLAGGSVARAAVTGQPWEPVLALWAAWPRRWWPDLDGVFVNGSPLLSWVADDGRRQGDDAAVLVAHSTPDLARAHLDDPDAALPVLLDAVQSLLGGHDVPAPGEAGVVRWTYARPAEGRGLPYYLGDELVGVCGDGWGPRPAVEQAWLSGHLLGTELAARLP